MDLWQEPINYHTVVVVQGAWRWRVSSDNKKRWDLLTKQTTFRGCVIFEIWLQKRRKHRMATKRLLADIELTISRVKFTPVRSLFQCCRYPPGFTTRCLLDLFLITSLYEDLEVVRSLISYLDTSTVEHQLYSSSQPMAALQQLRRLRAVALCLKFFPFHFRLAASWSRLRETCAQKNLSTW